MRKRGGAVGAAIHPLDPVAVERDSVRFSVETEESGSIAIL
jgi:hypothetical protein